LLITLTEVVPLTRCGRKVAPTGLVGSSVRIHEAQYPQIFSVVKRCCAMLDVSMPMVFVREDYQVPVVAVGFGEPYSLILSSHWVEHFREDE
jgi:hypothetical protein